MATMSIRGLDERAVARLKARAQREGTSVNGLVVRLLEERDVARTSAAPRVFDDLDALSGTWSAADARAFERATAPFAEVDPALWK